MRSTRSAARLFVLLLAAALPACDIDTEPLGQLTTESFFQTEAQAIQATNATYSWLRGWPVHVFSWIGITDIVSDDATKGSVPGDAGFLGDIDNLTFDPGSIAFNDPWTGYYQGIYRANVAIQGITGSSIDPTLKARLIAENKFLRAYFYFFLVRAWGGVPLITEPLRPGEFTQERVPAPDVYAQIEEDLTEAITVLPEKNGYGANDLGRATKGAARALLAEAHLYQGEYQEAYTRAAEVINSNQYSLLARYDSVFRRVGENASESVFEVQSVALEAGGAGSQYSEVQGVRGTPNLGWGFNTPSAELERAYEPGDPRLDATIMYPWELLPDGSGRVVHLNPNMPNNRYNQKVFIPDAPGTPRGPGNGGANIRRIRYSHVLLTGAEAAARTGRTAEAQTWLNLVRARARSGRTMTIGANVETLAPSIATGVLNLPANASRVMIRFVDPSDPDFTTLRGFTSACANTNCAAGPAGSPPPVQITNLDLITAVDGIAVTDLAGYHAQLDTKAPGQIVTLSIMRVTQAGTQNISVMVAARALLPNVTLSGDPLINAILAERRVELAMEQHRWFDLVRQGPARAQMFMSIHGKTFVTGRHELYPIPQGEVIIARLQQNPGY